MLFQSEILPLNPNLSELSLRKVHSHQHSKENIERESSQQQTRRKLRLDVVHARLAFLEFQEELTIAFEVSEDHNPRNQQKVIRDLGLDFWLIFFIHLREIILID